MLIIAVSQAAIRTGREGAAEDETMTLAELRTAMRVLREMEPQPAARPDPAPASAAATPRPAEAPAPGQTDLAAE